MSAEKDPLRDDSTVLAKRLTQVGVSTRSDYYAGFPHYCKLSEPNFFHLLTIGKVHWFPQLEKAHEAMADAVEGVQWLLTQNQ